MKPQALVLFPALAFVLMACPPSSHENDAGPTCDAIVTAANLSCDDPEVTRALQLVRAMSLEEKVQQMSGPAYNPNNMFDQETNERLKIPGHLYMDGPRGVRWYNSDYGTTVYPVAAARASTWDVALEKRVGTAMARELRYLGRHVLLAPTINQVMHPRWGRAQETYGEDSFLLGAMGSAFIEGAEYAPTVADPDDPSRPVEDTYRVQACAKHFAANNIEDTRIYVNAVLDARTLREVYLPHFKQAVDTGVSCIMTSYNRLNGSYNGYSKALVRDILKGEWKFHGYAISDWFAKGNTNTSPVAGLDVEMPFSSGPFPSQFDSAYFYGANLVSAVNAGQVDVALVDQAALRLLYAKVHDGVIDHPVQWTPYLTKSDETQALALQVAREGIVLLKNGPTAALSDDVLPLAKASMQKVVVVGKFANSENMGDKGSSDAKVVDGTLVITPYEGISTALAGDVATMHTWEQLAGHEADAADADVIFVIGAYYYADLARSSSGEEGEWKDRVSMRLPERDVANITAAVAIKASHPATKIVVVMKSGGAIDVKSWVDGVDAVVMTWYDGMKEGTALAEVLFGDVNPSGKTCQSFPMQESDLPAFDNATTGDVTYNYFHGYRWLEHQGVAARWPFGFGLSYTTFQYSNLVLSNGSVAADGTLTATVDVKNTGPRAGDEVVQLYVGYPNTAVTSGWGRAVKELKGFARATNIAPGETRTVTLTLHAADLAYWNESAGAMTVERTSHRLYVGPSSNADDPNMLTETFTIE